MCDMKFNGFDHSSFITSMGSGCFLQHYKAGQTVYRQGDPAHCLFYLQQGRVQIGVISDQGKEGVTAIHGPGEIFGHESLVRSAVHRSSAVTTGLASIARIENKTLIRVMREDPAIAINFLSFLLWRNSQIEEDLVDHLFNTSEKRLARHLLKLAGIDELDGALDPIESVQIPKISQEVLASRIGTTRGRINYFMNKFRRLDYIDYNGTITVRSSLATILGTGAPEVGNGTIRAPDLAGRSVSAAVAGRATAGRVSSAPWLAKTGSAHR